MTNNLTSQSEETELEVRPGGMLVQRRDGDDPDHSPGGEPSIKINVALVPAQHEVHVPAQYTFGELKMIIEQRTGLECGRQKLLFRGKEKEDGEYLHDAVKEEEQQPSISEVEDKEEILKALRAIDEVRAEVDMLAGRVSALEVAINCGTKVAEKEFVVSAELLMRQLLKLDMIEAEGEARVQRKAEVRRIQNFHELLDNLKATNAKPVNTNVNVATVTTDWETFDSGMGSLTPPPPGTSSSTAITEEWERFD
ncbi:unnamed protein product [Linum tenue]|uniref:BAG family molecular chaperone regulator 4 n=1 Tax=Linum tenue TaxID=586396 RepID=A0AAV0KVJ1_9ROSI|nr:unnamed protein product [Linum tenue]